MGHAPSTEFIREMTVKPGQMAKHDDRPEVEPLPKPCVDGFERMFLSLANNS